MNACGAMIRGEAAEDRLAIHRFGFVPAVPKSLRCEYPIPDEGFMVAELVPGVLKGRSGLVRYRPEFAEV
jgi:putative acetyltransferase